MSLVHGRGVEKYGREAEGAKKMYLIYKTT